jgi:hypothetical protein
MDLQAWMGSGLILIAVIIGALVPPSPQALGGATEPA